MSASIHISSASPPHTAHLPEFLRLFDEATLWLVSRGQPGQWGTNPPSANSVFVDFIARLLERDLTVVFARVHSGAPILGIIAFDEAPTPGSSTPIAREREVYVHILLTTRDPAYRGLGERLLQEAKAEARKRGIGLLRLSCYAGGGGGLIRVYEAMGFRRNPKEIIEIPNWDGGGLWPKVVMEMEVGPVEERPLGSG